MRHARALDGGLEAHQESIAVASVVQDHDAEILYAGTIGTRQCDIDHLIREMPSKATLLVFAYEASPCGYRLYRY